MNKNAPTFESLARELAATTKRLAPVLAVYDDEDQANKYIATHKDITGTFAKILARSNQLADYRVAGFPRFESLADLELYARTLDRRQRGARSGPARVDWEGDWAGNDADRARTLCIFLQKLEAEAPSRTERRKANRKTPTAREAEQRADSIQRAFEQLIREGKPTTRDPLLTRARALHAQRYGKAALPPTKGDIAMHPCWQKKAPVTQTFEHLDSENAKEATTARTHLARQMGFESVADFSKWHDNAPEEERHAAMERVRALVAAGLEPLVTMGCGKPDIRHVAENGEVRRSGQRGRRSGSGG
ncbi:MAG: hypothetical protein HUU18_05190 [Phycisphaerales bacterium]|nr:hypothetical protein [Phycisphaerales bacterium]